MINFNQLSLNKHGLTVAEVEKTYNLLLENYGLYHDIDIRELKLDIDIIFVYKLFSTFVGKFRNDTVCKIFLNSAFLRNKEDLLKTLSHELTHYIQRTINVNNIYSDYNSNIEYELQPVEQEAMAFSWITRGINKYEYDTYKETKVLYHKVNDKIRSKKSW